MSERRGSDKRSRTNEQDRWRKTWSAHNVLAIPLRRAREGEKTGAKKDRFSQASSQKKVMMMMVEYKKSEGK